MWPLAVFLVLALAARAAGLTCPQVAALTDLRVTQLSGKWVLLEYALFSEGIPPAACPDREAQCVTAKVRANETHVSTKLKRFLSPEDTLTQRRTFHVAEGGGRWARGDSEVVVLAADPARFFVDLTCEPGSGQEALPARVNLYVRRLPEEAGGTEETRGRRRPSYQPMSEAELAKLRATVALGLGVGELRTTRYDLECFRRKEAKKKTVFRGDAK